MKLTISTFNIQNKYYIKKYSGIDKYGDHTKDLKKFINENKIDILGIQEITKPYQKRFFPLIKSKYFIYGKYRFTKIGNILPILTRFNEATSIITKRKVLSTKTRHIPSFPSIPRIYTEVTLQIDLQTIKVINTHIDVVSDKIKEKQLNYIIKKIKRIKQPLILMGDFNSTTSDVFFDNFISKMKNMGYKRVGVFESTHKCRKLPIDHIFIPKTWTIEEISIITLKNKMSDHKPIIVKVSL